MISIVKYSLLFFLIANMTGCGTREFFGFEEKKIPLPGDRVSILKADINKTEDIRSDTKVILSKLEENINWSQSLNSPTHLSKNFLANSEFNKFNRIIAGSGENKESKILSQPVIQNNILFFIDAKSNILSYDLENKKVLWRTRLVLKNDKDHSMGGGLAVYGNSVFINSPYGEVFSLNKKDGSIIWKRKVLSPLRSAPTIVENRVLSLTIDNRLLVLDSNNGQLMWSHEGIFNNTSIISSPKVAVDQNIIVVPYSNGDYFSFNLTNGVELWKGSIVDLEQTKTTNTFNDIDASPVFINNSVIIASTTGRLISLDKRNGSKNWDRFLNTSQTPLANGNSIYLINNNKEIINLDIKNGKIRWTTKIEENLSEGYLNIWYTPILVNNKLLLVGGDRRMVLLNPMNGEIIKIKKLPSLPASPPFVSRKKIFLNLRNGDVISIE